MTDPTFVYFARTSDYSMVKIGLSVCPGARLSALRSHTRNQFGRADVEMIGAVEGGFALEVELHLLLAEYSIDHEWFRPAPRVLELIESFRSKFIPPYALQTVSKRALREELRRHKEYVT